jgi:hypothetical protein
MIRNNDPSAVLAGVRRITGNPLATSSLLDVTKITQNFKVAYHYSLIACCSMLALALSCAPDSALAWAVYNSTCKTPAASPVHVWYVNPGASYTNSAGVAVGAGDTPDAAHGGVATTTGSHIGHVGTADGSAAHPFNSLAGVFTGGKIVHVDGYGYPLLSTVGYDHYGVNAGFGAGVGVNKLRRDVDWNPVFPKADRINPGDQIILASANYGGVGTGYSGIDTANVDASGKIDFVRIDADGGATPIFTTLSVGGSKGFQFGGITVSSLLGQGAANESSLLYINGNAATPTSNIIFGGTLESYANWAAFNADFAANGAAAVNDSRYARIIGLGGTAKQAYLYDKLRNGLTVTGDDAAGADVNCISITGTHETFVATGVSTYQIGKFLFWANTVDHFGEDGFDMQHESNINIAWNTFKDPLNLGDGNHPDTFQYGGQVTKAGPFSGIVITRNTEIERTDPNNPLPQQITFYQHTNSDELDGTAITDNRSSTSNCPGIALGNDHNAIVANNTILGNGVTPGWGCPAPKVGEASVGVHNLFYNNVASQFYQPCNTGTVWSHNYMLLARANGVPSRGILAYCNSGTIAYTGSDGTYGGVTVDTRNSATYAFADYDPPATGVNSTGSPNLMPSAHGPLAGAGVRNANVPTININGTAWPAGVPNIGAF